MQPVDRKNPLLPRLLAVAMLGLVATATLRGGSCFERPLRVGTFNIEHLGARGAPTDMNRLADVILSTEADVLGVQEIEGLPKADELMTLLAQRSSRHFAHALTRCGGQNTMRVGYFYDTDRVQLLAKTEYPELSPEPDDGKKCAVDRPGLAARFAPVRGGEPFQLLVFHLVMGKDQMPKRRAQWSKAHAIAAKLGKETPVAILGDANSTGFIDNDGGERTFILGEAKKANLDVLTTDVECTEYYRLKKEEPLTPSHLDHLVATPGLARRGSAKVHGFCAALRCRVPSEDPADFKTVSDHCPVTIDL